MKKEKLTGSGQLDKTKKIKHKNMTEAKQTKQTATETEIKYQIDEEKWNTAMRWLAAIATQLIEMGYDNEGNEILDAITEISEIKEQLS